MAAKYLFTHQAVNDLESIFDYLSEKSPQSAARFSENLEAKCGKLTLSPAMGKMRNELILGLRSLPVGKYIIFYRQKNKNIEIIRLLHGARDILRAFSS
ncbi:type II toxin-antitoxin system RelE/ParE family toxin [bacterium]|nr:type II toxin-antitoxin system RelE/ParE family toxin [bacterium]